jgi:hypothetical protein
MCCVEGGGAQKKSFGRAAATMSGGRICIARQTPKVGRSSNFKFHPAPAQARTKDIELKRQQQRRRRHQRRRRRLGRRLGRRLFCKLLASRPARERRARPLDRLFSRAATRRRRQPKTAPPERRHHHICIRTRATLVRPDGTQLCWRCAATAALKPQIPAARDSLSWRWLAGCAGQKWRADEEKAASKIQRRRVGALQRGTGRPAGRAAPSDRTGPAQPGDSGARPHKSRPGSWLLVSLLLPLLLVALVVAAVSPPVTRH